MVNLLLIRHAETIHNVGLCWAGHLDSPLTNHGASQAALLGPHLASLFPHITNIFISPLSRTQHTAAAIVKCLPAGPRSIVTTPLIIERDFGAVDGLPWSANHPGLDTIEKMAAVEMRADDFLDEHLIDAVLYAKDPQDTVLVVSHGAFLPVLWRRMQERFTCEATEGKIRFPNTAYMHIRADLDKDTLEVVSPPGVPHLKGLKRSGGGVGNAQWDPKQRPLESFWSTKEEGKI
ncbi:histidine phosphatase superfamily [Geopyxis carbonaria]|nr:histidine phosphatase superfamily [Geopyxis carbonaria]